MDRGLKAAFLFSLVVVAQADRALTAHKPSTGGLHAVAILRSPINTAGAGSPVVIGLASEAAPIAVGNYMITNGNGTWTYSYYSNNGNLNGNDAGMGGDYVFPNHNVAFYTSNAVAGAAIAGLGVGTFAPSEDYPAGSPVLTAVTNIESPVARYTLGLTSVVFTGAKTGIAVGRYGGFHDYDPLNGVTPNANVAQGQQKLNILLTYDGATTWARASGVPQPSTVTVAFPFVGGSGGTAAGTFTVPPYPTVSIGDLTDVFMASKSLGWAVGGNDVTNALSVSTGAGLGPAASTNQPAAAPGDLAATPPIVSSVALGMVIMTQNGGSIWKNIPIYISYAALVPLMTNNDPSIKNIYNTPIPGILFGVMSDASGKHVYAVGSPSSLWSTSATAQVSVTSNVAAGALTSLQVKTYGTILYSGNSGMSWVQQTAPTLYSGTVHYTLFDVAVQKGTTAIAVGGSAGVKFGSKSAGTIIYTMNGGFSWTQSVYPSSTGTKAPVFTCVALQPSVSGVQNVWVGGYTTRSDNALGDGAATPPVVVVSAADFYPVAAVAGYNPTTADPVSSGVPRSKGQIYTILISKDGGKTFAAAPTAGLPTGYVVTSFTHATTDTLVTDRSVYGITWDNAMHGWIYGYGYIMATQDGGVTWVYETPADVGVTSVTPKVTAIASVPTTY